MTEITRGSVVALEHLRCSSPGKWSRKVFCLPARSHLPVQPSIVASSTFRVNTGICFFLDYVEDIYLVVLFVLSRLDVSNTIIAIYCM